MHSVSLAEKKLHQLFGLTPSQVQKVLSTALDCGRQEGVYCDIFFQKGTTQVFSFEEGKLKPAFKPVSGAGVRVTIGDKTGYATCDKVNMTNLIAAAKEARTIVKYGTASVSVGEQEVVQRANLYPIIQSPVYAVDFATKIKLLRDIDACARASDPRITNTEIMLLVQDDEVIIANSLSKTAGELFYDNRPLVRMKVVSYASNGTRTESGSAGGGGRSDFDFFLKGDKWKQIAQESAKNAVELLSAIDAPAGEMDVVLGSGWSGVLVHEAVGHGLEGDFNRQKLSAFSGHMGEMVASPVCTIIDDGALPGQRGSLNFDDEGTPTRKSVLIENGRLVGYMQDRQNAGLMGVAPTGNGRRQDYKSIPVPRMTNTYLAAGEHAPEEIIRSVKKGLYISVFGGGQVNITSGDYVFAADAAYLIEDGKLGPLVRGATLVGNGPKSMQKITMVGNDMALDPGIGTCGKDGQSVPVNVGMPHIRINGMTVGGRNS